MQMFNNNEDITKKITQQHDGSPQIFSLISGCKLIEEKLPENYTPSVHKAAPTAQSLAQQIGYFNDTAVYKINNEQYKQALIFLKQAERLLQTALKNEIKINGIHIITVIQNIACVYQKLWQLEKAEAFIKAIIQNVESELKFKDLRGQQSKQAYLQATVTQKQSLKTSIIKNLFIINAYFQYFAICSQLGKHTISNEYMKKILNLLKDICGKMIQLQIILSYQSSSYQCYGNYSLDYLLNIKENVNINTASVSQHIAQIGHLVNSVKTIETKEQNETEELIYLQNFIPNKITEIFHMTINDCYESFQIKEFSIQIIKMKLILYFSFSFLCMASQNRLTAAQKYSQHRKFTQPYKISKIFHLKSIEIYIKNIQYNSKYLEYLLESFQKNYEINLEKKRLSHIIKHSRKQNIEAQQDLIFKNRMLQASIVKSQQKLEECSIERLKNLQEYEPYQTNRGFDAGKKDMTTKNSYGIEEKAPQSQKRTDSKKQILKNRDKSNKGTISNSKYYKPKVRQEKGLGQRSSKSSKKSKTSVKEQNIYQSKGSSQSIKATKIKSTKLITNKLAKYRLSSQENNIKNIKMISSQKVINNPTHQYQDKGNKIYQQKIQNVSDPYNNRNSSKSQRNQYKIISDRQIKPNQEYLPEKIENGRKGTQKYIPKEENRKLLEKQKRQTKKSNQSLKEKNSYGLKRQLKSNTKDPVKPIKRVGLTERYRTERSSQEELKKLAKKYK